MAAPHRRESCHARPGISHYRSARRHLRARRQRRAGALWAALRRSRAPAADASRLGPGRVAAGARDGQALRRAALLRRDDAPARRPEPLGRQPGAAFGGDASPAAGERREILDAYYHPHRRTRRRGDRGGGADEGRSRRPRRLAQLHARAARPCAHGRHRHALRPGAAGRGRVRDGVDRGAAGAPTRRCACAATIPTSARATA